MHGLFVSEHLCLLVHLNGKFILGYIKKAWCHKWMNEDIASNHPYNMEILLNLKGNLIIYESAETEPFHILASHFHLDTFQFEFYMHFVCFTRIIECNSADLFKCLYAYFSCVFKTILHTFLNTYLISKKQ